MFGRLIAAAATYLRFHALARGICATYSLIQLPITFPIVFVPTGIRGVPKPRILRPAISEKKRVSDIDVQIGTRVRLLREQRGMTRATLALALNISNQQIQKYESGQNRMSAGLLPKLAGVLGVPVSYLFEDLQEDQPNLVHTTPKAFEGRAAAILGLSAQCLAFVRMFVGIKDPKARSSVTALVNSLTERDDEGP